MEGKNYAVKTKEMSVVDGKVVIDSEELAAAVQDQLVDLTGEEENELSINFGCHLFSTR